MEIQPVVAGSASRAVLQARSLGLRLVIGADHPTLLRECRYCTMISVNVNSATAKIAAREDQFQISDLAGCYRMVRVLVFVPAMVPAQELHVIH